MFYVYLDLVNIYAPKINETQRRGMVFGAALTAFLSAFIWPLTMPFLTISMVHSIVHFIKVALFPKTVDLIQKEAELDLKIKKLEVYLNDDSSREAFLKEWGTRGGASEPDADIKKSQ